MEEHDCSGPSLWSMFQRAEGMLHVFFFTSCALSQIDPNLGLSGIGKGWPRLKLCRWLPAPGATVELNELFGAHEVLIGGSNKVALGVVLLGSLRWWLRVRWQKGLWV